MVDAPSDRLAERYCLRLSAQWQQWFDVDAPGQLLAGPFRSAIQVSDLLEAAPPDIWPGFMLPDTLPIVSNDYGDWWCLRVGPDDTIAEVIQWSHAGGDWLPIGSSMAEAALWDYVQHWRGRAIAVAQAAHEYPARKSVDSIDSDFPSKFLPWLSHGLACSTQFLHELLGSFEAGYYRQGLERLFSQGWSRSAAACELVEVALQGQLGRLADNQLARQCGINWVPEFTSWLFDTQMIGDSARNLLLEHAQDVRFEQDWQAAEHWAEQIANERSDLSWPGDISGWAALRRGDRDQAAQRWFNHRYGSAFTDQSVRLRTHWFAENFGKFAVAQLANLRPHLSDAQASDAYLQLLWHEPAQRTRSAVREFWLTRARQSLQQGRFEESYRTYTMAGWDLGAERMSDYVEILDGLVTSAERAGWAARAAVAAAHAECLKRRVSSK